MLTRLFDWRVGAGTEVTRPAIAIHSTVYDAYSKFVIVLAVTIKTDHFKNSITNSSFLLNHDLINVFLFTIMLTQCVPNTLDLFYILSTR